MDAGGGMQFGIRGELEVRRGGRPVVLQGGGQRALLAALLLQANRRVPVERLIDELWGPEAGAGAIKRLQVAVSRLRRALDPGAEHGRGEPVLATESGGYVLRVAPEALDAECFERLVGEGRRARDAGRPETAGQTLRAALGLWRGPALADVSYERFAQSEIGRLEELRLVARESRIEADLRLGRHVELVAELEALAAEHPDREHVTGQLMLVLYRSGRQADALAAFQRTRAYLAEDLGLEPAPALRALQEKVLNHDAALQGREPPRSPNGETPLAIPAGLSAGERFVGRAPELVCLRRRWEAATAGRPVVVLIEGPAGVGKSRL